MDLVQFAAEIFRRPTVPTFVVFVPFDKVHPLRHIICRIRLQ